MAQATLDAQLPPEVRVPLKGIAYYCVNPSCGTAYFTGWGTSILASRLRSPAYPKNATAPICPCFGLRADEVRDDAQNGVRDRVRALVERSRGPQAQCLLRCPDGRSCVPRVLRLFRESFVERPAGP